jgi:hypothetical protein
MIAVRASVAAASKTAKAAIVTAAMTERPRIPEN